MYVQIVEFPSPEWISEMALLFINTFVNFLIRNPLVFNSAVRPFHIYVDNKIETQTCRIEINAKYKNVKALF